MAEFQTTPAEPGPEGGAPQGAPHGPSWHWPVAIVVGLTLVIAVNAAFIVVAVSGADEVVESYITEER